MAELAAAAAAQPAAQPIVTPLFTGRVRWLIAALLVLGPLLQVIEFTAIAQPDDNNARILVWAANPLAAELSLAAGLLAVPFLLAGAWIVVALCRQHTPRLAWAAGAFMTCAMIGLAAVHGYELAAYGLVALGDQLSALNVLEGVALGIPGGVMFVLFLVGAVLGTLALAVAVWLSPRLPRWAALFILAFAVLDFAISQPIISHVINLIGFVYLAWAVVAGYTRQRA